MAEFILNNSLPLFQNFWSILTGIQRHVSYSLLFIELLSNFCVGRFKGHRFNMTINSHPRSLFIFAIICIFSLIIDH